jgi:chromosome segregation ATPase
MDSTRELDQIRSELDRLHDRTNANKTEIASHEAVCEERYQQIVLTLGQMREDMEAMSQTVSELKDLATQGQTSLKTLLWVGGASAAVFGFFLMVYDYFK